jgi:predicted nucleotidyltransferase
MIKKFFEFAQFSQSQFEPIKSFYLQDELNPEVWTNFELDSDLREDLLQIAEDYLEYLDFEDIELEDIVLTGSLANYNWSKYSDFDIHLIFDFSQINDDVDFVQKYLDAKEKTWKLQHDLKLKGFDVELFCENINSETISTGVYSLRNDKWVKKPSRVNFVPDENQIRKKASKFMREIKEIESELESGEDLEELSDRISKVWKKIKDSRKAGLNKEGEFSLENLVFKLLRRNGYIQRIIDAKREAYDKRYK